MELLIERNMVCNLFYPIHEIWIECYDCQMQMSVQFQKRFTTAELSSLSLTECQMSLTSYALLCSLNSSLKLRWVIDYQIAPLLKRLFFHKRQHMVQMSSDISSKCRVKLGISTMKMIYCIICIIHRSHILHTRPSLPSAYSRSKLLL
jgi:hypothetical protein